MESSGGEGEVGDGGGGRGEVGNSATAQFVWSQLLVRQPYTKIRKVPAESMWKGQKIPRIYLIKPKTLKIAS